MEFIIETEIECGSAVNLYSKDLIQNQLWSQAYVSLIVFLNSFSLFLTLPFGSKPNSNTKRKKISKSPQILFIKIISILLEVSGSLYFQLE